MMSTLLSDVQAFVSQNIGEFHDRRLQNLQTLKLASLLKRKNPYLFRAKDIATGQDLVRTLLDAHLSSQEEGIFGNFLERVAIFVAGEVFSGRKSAVDGIDLEFVRDDCLYLVSIKSGPNWGNSQQYKRLEAVFAAAAKRLATSGAQQAHKFINGCCYGKETASPSPLFQKVCGQAFWELISASDELYIEIIEPLGYDAARYNAEFAAKYAQVINTFTQQFLDQYADNGVIQWDKLLRFNSARKGIPG